MTNPTNTEAELREKIVSEIQHTPGEFQVYTIMAEEAAKRIMPHIIAHTAKAVEGAIKEGFYRGQANAGVKLEKCHQNWKRWNTPDEVKYQLKRSFSQKIVESNKKIQKD